MKLFRILTAFLLILVISSTQAFALNIPGILTTTYQYDTASRLTAINYQPSAINYSYTYNDIGNRTSFTEPLGVHNYEYDNIDQLIQATHPALPEENFTYDALGNRNPLSTTHDEANRLLSDGQYSYTYDSNGNRIAKEDIDTGEITTYIYNAENQLITINYPLSTINYFYDGLGRRIEKNVGGEITRYIYDGMDVLAEFNGTNELIRSYVHGPSVDEPLELNAGPTTYYYISDGLGSITALIDSAGNIVEQYRYDSFGNVTILNSTDETIPESAYNNRYMFTAREYDAETRLYYYRLRYYDPLVGRFLQEDPVGYLLGPNLYTYVNNNPVNWIDPFGLFIFDESVRNRYPNTVDYIDKSRPSKKEYEGYSKYGQASKGNVDAAYTKGNPPRINPTPLAGSNGNFTPNTGSHVININETIFDALEKGMPGSRTLLDSTIGHELTHYFDDLDGIDFPGEEGQLFEEYVYGEDIDTLQQSIEYENKTR